MMEIIFFFTKNINDLRKRRSFKINRFIKIVMLKNNLTLDKIKILFNKREVWYNI